jgi:hypothetical protein
MNPHWRTTTVLALCQRMLDTRAFDALPILADALQDAGCTDTELLTRCQDPNLKPVLAERLTNLIYSDETAAAVRWLEQFARDIGYEDEDPPTYSYEAVVEIGREGATSGGMYFWTDSGADYFRGDPANRREFFRNWSLVTGVEVPEEDQENMTFACAC